jgi:hypothetical protein
MRGSSAPQIAGSHHAKALNRCADVAVFGWRRGSSESRRESGAASEADHEPGRGTPVARLILRVRASDPVLVKGSLEDAQTVRRPADGLFGAPRWPARSATASSAARRSSGQAARPFGGGRHRPGEQAGRKGRGGDDGRRPRVFRSPTAMPALRERVPAELGVGRQRREVSLRRGRARLAVGGDEL